MPNPKENVLMQLRTLFFEALSFLAGPLSHLQGECHPYSLAHLSPLHSEALLKRTYKHHVHVAWYSAWLIKCALCLFFFSFWCWGSNPGPLGILDQPLQLRYTAIPYPHTHGYWGEKVNEQVA